MNKEQFTKELVNNLTAILGDGYSVCTEHVTKNNGVEHVGIVIRRPNQNVCPNIYIENFYSQFLKGRSIESIAEEILSLYNSKKDYMTDFNVEKELGQAKERIFFKLVNAEANRMLLDIAPHKLWNDLAIIYYVDFGEEEGYHKFLTINNMIMELLDLTPDELEQLAITNTEKRMSAQISGISSMLDNLLGLDSELEEDLPDDELFYVITNQEKSNGACTVLYHNVLSDFAERMNVDKVYLIPSSINEMLLIPDRGNMSVKELNAMLKSVNNTEVNPEEVLSSNCYIYTRQTNLISVA
ncbi:MAG: DUF5688 family protein [Agathobacter sp.]